MCPLHQGGGLTLAKTSVHTHRPPSLRPYRRPHSACKQTDPERPSHRAGPRLRLCLRSGRGRVAGPGKCSPWVRPGAWPNDTPASRTAAKNPLVDACPPAL